MGNDVNVNGTCIIVCAGEFVPIEIEKKDGDFLIAADAGFSYCEMLGMLPDYIIGDMDSLPSHEQETVNQIRMDAPERVRILPKEKDDTDTLAAIKYGLQKGYKKFRLYGALGGRMDHSLANIQCLKYIKDQGAKGYIIAHDQMMTVIQNEEVHFHAGMEGTMSVFALDQESRNVTIRGLKYEATKVTLTNAFPLGVSNEFIGKEASIAVEDGALLIIVNY